jgi:flavodoxin
VRTAIVSVSVHHGNTRRVAEAMAVPLGAALLSVEEALTADLRTLDLIGLGSGIYFGRHHSSLLRLVQDVQFMPPRCFVFSTAGISSLAGLWHGSLRRRLRQRQSEIVGQFHCPGWDTVGPLWLFGGLHSARPNERDLSRAAEFAEALRTKLEPA